MNFYTMNYKKEKRRKKKKCQAASHVLILSTAQVSSEELYTHPCPVLGQF